MSSKDVPSPKPAIRILRLPEVCQITGFRASWIYQLQAENRFPHSVKIGERTVGWLEHEVQAWLAERIDESRAPPEKGSTATALKPRGRPRGP